MEKCEFRKKKIEFFGLIFSGEGVSPDPKKVADLHRAAEPKNASEVRSFLGMAQYSARYIKDFATITEPLVALTKQDNDWQWGKKEVKAFNAVKAGLAESATTAYFDVKKAIAIVVDASPVGLAALLVQEKRVVVYGSRALSDVETRYSQTEREALAVVWACEHFDKFINGAPQSTVVLIRQRKTGKLSTPFHPRPLVVTNRKGSMVTASRQDGSLVTRNTSMFHRLPHEVAEDHPLIDDEDTEDETEMAVPPEPPSPGRDRERVTPSVMAEVPRRSARPRKPTQRLLEQV